jgi:hypothetical protein
MRRNEKGTTQNNQAIGKAKKTHLQRSREIKTRSNTISQAAIIKTDILKLLPLTLHLLIVQIVYLSLTRALFTLFVNASGSERRRVHDYSRIFIAIIYLNYYK